MAGPRDQSRADPGATTRVAEGHAARASREASPVTATAGWLREKRPVLRFLLIFALLLGAFYAVFLLPPSRYPRVGNAFNTYLSFYGQLAGWVINLFGEGATVGGQFITSSRFSVRVVRGCDAMEATAMLVAAIMASPVSISRKLPGVVGGVLLLGVLNLVRIVSLFYIGIHWPDAFESIHFHVWQPVFIVLAVAGWLAWAVWARTGMRNAERGTRNATTAEGGSANSDG